MDRLTLLKREREQISKMQTLSFSLKDQCEEWYDNEIRAIEEYGSANPEVSHKNVWVKDDDIEVMRILFGATIGDLRNQERWNDAKEMQDILGRLMTALKN